MPEITISERDYADLTAYRMLGSVSEINKRVEDLTKDNGKQRDEIRELKEKAKGLPPEGAVVLQGDEAKAWTDFKVLDLKPEDVKKTVEERDILKADKATRDRKDALGKAMDTEGWNAKSAGIVARMLGDLSLELKDEDVEIKQNGKTEKVKKPVGYVTMDGKSVRLSEWAKTEDGLSELLTLPSGGTGGESGRPFTEQRGGGGDPKKGEASGGIDDMIARNQAAAKAATPLRPAAAKT